MPIEGSKAQISRNLGLDLGAYIQGKSFNRSVSISESSPVDCAPSTTSDESGASTTFPISSRRIVSGGNAMSEPSPSPLSSATATISPESPPPQSSIMFPVSESARESPAGTENPTNPFGSHNPSDPSSQLITTTAPSSSTTNSLPCCSTTGAGQSRLRAKNPYTPEFTALFQNPVTHRTVSLLSHLIDTRLSPEWRTALFNRSTSSTLSPALRGSDSVSTPPPAVDSTDSGPLRRCGPPTSLSPTDEIAVTKRFKHSDDSATFDATDLRPMDSLHKTLSEPRPPTFITGTSSGPSGDSFVPLRLVNCVCRLADHFESRYRDKLGDLLEDVARLSASHSETESGVESALESSTTEPNGAQSITAINTVSVLLIRSARSRFHQVLSELFRERINWGRIVAMFAFVRALCEHVETEAEVRSYSGVTSGIEEEEGHEQHAHQTTVAPALGSSQDANVDHPTETVALESPLASTTTPPLLAHSGNRPGSSVQQPQLSTTNGTEVDPNFTGLRAAHYVAWTTEFIHGSHGIWDWISTNGGWDGLMKFESERGISDAGGDRILVGFTEDDAMRLLRRAVTGVATLAVGAVGLVAALRYFSKRL